MNSVCKQVCNKHSRATQVVGISISYTVGSLYIRLGPSRTLRILPKLSQTDIWYTSLSFSTPGIMYKCPGSDILLGTLLAHAKHVWDTSRHTLARFGAYSGNVLCVTNIKAGHSTP